MSEEAHPIEIENDPVPNEQEKDKAAKPDVRVYLEEKVFPILTSGLEELLNAVDEREKKIQEEEDIPEIHPLFFLARYLMKNAPQQTGQHSGKSSSRSKHSSLSKKSASTTHSNLETNTNEIDSITAEDIQPSTTEVQTEAE